MARAINVLLSVNDDEFDLSNLGLVSMTFDRFIAVQNIQDKHFLANMDITMFDPTGYKLLSLLQRQNNRIKVRYGFEDQLSEYYTLNMLKFNSTYNDLGVMVAVGAVGNPIKRAFGAENFPPETKVREILELFAKRNNWYIGPPGSNEYISVGNLRLDRLLVKRRDETDIEFVNNKLLPACNRIVSTDVDRRILNFWDVSLVQKGIRAEFYFRIKGQRTNPRRIWTYEYGVNTNNNIISLTNSVDQSFLIDGLTIQIPVVASDFLFNEEGVYEEVESILESKVDTIEKIIRENGLPYISPNNFMWNIQLIQAEDTGTDKNYEDIILKSIEEVMNKVNSIDMEVIGNPKISHLDLIDLRVMNRGDDGEGTLNIISSNSSVGSYWRVIGIRELIGLDGYTTQLKLVRDIPDLEFETPKQAGGGGTFEIEEA